MAGIGFLAPWVLLGLAILPVIWWLLRALPPQPLRRVFGGMIFLEGMQDSKETPERTPWWLLALRLLAISLLIIGLARPVMNLSEQSEGSGPILLIVDNTWPAANHWSERQDAIRSLMLRRGMDDRPIRLLTTAAPATLSDPLTASAIRERIEGLIPSSESADRDQTLTAIEQAGIDGVEVIFISDGTIGRKPADRRFLDWMQEQSAISIFRIPAYRPVALTALTPNANVLTASIARIGGGSATGTLRAVRADGEDLGTFPFETDSDTGEAQAAIDLPIALRNEIARLVIDGHRTAGATWLTDSGVRRIQAGVFADRAETLLDSGFYIEQALDPFAAISRGDVDDLITRETSMIVLDDVGTLRLSDETALLEWVDDGGILVRFAGPNTANAAAASSSETRNPTFPVIVRNSERAFGGALTWEDPQGIAAFPADSPFSDLSVDDGVIVQRQLLSRPGREPGDLTWVSLTDGTPLVTARAQGRGFLILFHITASPTWSDLPVSGLFPQMMGRLARLAAGDSVRDTEVALAPYRLLDGFGRFIDPPANAVAATGAQMSAAAVPPGLYGAREAAIAVNAYSSNHPTIDPLTPSQLPGAARILGPDGGVTRALGPVLIVLGLILFLLDAAIIQALTWSHHRAGRVGLASLGMMLALLSANDVYAQSVSVRPPPSASLIDAALEVRLAYIRTGDATLDRISHQGLSGLARQATRRSALEPGEPIGVDIETDDLSVFPLLYWPISEDSPPPSDSALGQLESFMATGGLLIIDTRDGEQSAQGIETPTQRYLRSILLRMDIPPLEPLPADHILTKSFYRLQDLHGRNTGGTVWVEAEASLSDSTDSVPSLIIAGRDWASAWAVDEFGRPLRPAGPGGEGRREFAFRAGINIAMVALTGSYKEDQIHVQDQLDRLEGAR